MTEPVLRVDDLRVAYGPIEAVRGISFTVDVGDVVALLGPNGAGKSSTLRALSGLSDFAGVVRFDGRETRRMSPERLARAGMLHVPEGRQIFPTLTVHENLQVASAARARRDADVGPEDVYELFPLLAPLRRRHGWALSGGEQQMLAIGRALVGSPRLLLLDEPSLGLAPALVEVVFASLDRLASEIPILLVEQNTTVALEACTRAHVLSEGTIVLSGTGAELHESKDLMESFLGHRDVDRGT